MWADALYRAFAGRVAAHCRRAPEVVTGRPGARRLAVRPTRRVVGGTFGRLGRYRRLSKDGQTIPESGEAWASVAMVRHAGLRGAPSGAAVVGPVTTRQLSSARPSLLSGDSSPKTRALCPARRPRAWSRSWKRK